MGIFYKAKLLIFDVFYDKFYFIALRKKDKTKIMKLEIVLITRWEQFLKF